jgi:hypothetical protein
LPTLRFDGPTLEEAVEAAKRQLGPAPRIVAATRVRKGGVGGFFAREHVEVEVEVDGAPGSGRQATRAPRENQPSRQPAPPGAAPSQPVAGSAKAASAAREETGREPGYQSREARGPEPRRAAPRRPSPPPTGAGRGLSDNDDPMSALIEEMADNGPSSVLDLAEKINAEQGHFALAEHDGGQGRGSGGTPAKEAPGRATSNRATSNRATSNQETLGRSASRKSADSESVSRENASRESADWEIAEERFPSDALGEREPIGPITAANMPRSGSRSEDRRDEKKGRRWWQTQPDEQADEQASDDPEGPEHAPSAGFAAVLERIAREAGLAAPGSEGVGTAFRTPEPSPASHADVILTELGPTTPRPTTKPREQDNARGQAALRSPEPHALAERPGVLEPRQATTTVDLAERRAPATQREWTEPLWLRAAGERGGEPRWLAAPAVLARLSQPEPHSAPQFAPQPAPLAPAVPERRGSQLAPQLGPQPAPRLAPQPAWLAPTASGARLPEPAPRFASLAPAVPGQLSELGLALQRLGVPTQACAAVTPEASREIIEGELRRALDLALPPLPPAPKSSSSVVAVVGPPNTVMSTARGIARDLGAPPDEVALATQRKVWRPQDRVIQSAEVAIEERRSWRWRDHPSVVAIEQEVRPDRSAWTTEILQALEPTLCWGVAKASHKPEDLAAWSDALGGLDVLALIELDGTTTPAAALASPIPVGSLDGEPATPALWATLLCARLMG